MVRKGKLPGSTAGPKIEIVYGVEPVRELVLACAGAVRTLYIRLGKERRFGDEIAKVREGGGEVVAVDEARLAGLAGGGARHQGIVAVMRGYRYAAIDELLEQKPDPILLVDEVTDPRNLGAMLRAAEGAGVGGVIVARDRTAGLTPAAVKASAGAWAYLKIARCGNVARALDQLKEAGYWTVALAPGAELSIYELDVRGPLVLVVGSEGSGVRRLVRETVDYVVGIPMRGKMSSLNVSVAAAVALFEIGRRRRAADCCRQDRN